MEGRVLLLTIDWAIKLSKIKMGYFKLETGLLLKCSLAWEKLWVPSQRSTKTKIKGTHMCMHTHTRTQACTHSFTWRHFAWGFVCCSFYTGSHRAQMGLKFSLQPSWIWTPDPMASRHQMLGLEAWWPCLVSNRIFFKWNPFPNNNTLTSNPQKRAIFVRKHIVFSMSAWLCVCVYVPSAINPPLSYTPIPFWQFLNKLYNFKIKVKSVYWNAVKFFFSRHA